MCEKPLVLNPWNLDALDKIEEETGKKVYTLLQLRYQPDLIQLKNQIAGSSPAEKHEVELTYITGRGKWYRYSWKGDEIKSGGVATNIGIHFFDLLTWIFGGVESAFAHRRDGLRAEGSGPTRPRTKVEGQKTRAFEDRRDEFEKYPSGSTRIRIDPKIVKSSGFV